MCCEFSGSPGEELRLLRAWRGGDRRAAGVLYRLHAPEVRRFFRRAEPEHGADLVQETFAALLGRTTCEPRSVRGYVMAIARNVLCRHLRRKYKRRQECADYVDACVGAACAWWPAQALEEQEKQAAWARAIDALTREEREILRLRYGEALSVEATARRLRISPTTLPGRAQRAKQRLRRGLPRELLGRGGRSRGGGGGGGGSGGSGGAGVGEDPARDLG